MPRNEDLYNEQLDYASVIANDLNINIVTCGDCGAVILHSLDMGNIECYQCGMVSEPCDFPDLFY